MHSPENNVHGKLRTMQRQLRIASTAATVLAVLSIAAVAVPLWFMTDQTSALLVTLCVAAAMGGVLFMSRGLIAPMREQLEQAKRVANSPGRPMLMKLTWAYNLTGYLARLWEPGAHEDDAPKRPVWGLASLRTERKWPRLGKNPAPVTVYMTAAGPGQPLVVDAGSSVFWGKMVSKEQAGAGWGLLAALFILVALIGVAAMGMSLWLASHEREAYAKEARLARESLTWPTAPGRILSSTVADVRIPRGKGSTPGHEARIRYEYTVDGERYENDFIHFGYAKHSGLAPANSLVQRYPVEKQVRIAYDPGKPAFSVLEPGHLQEVATNARKTNRQAYLVLGLSAILVVLPLAALAVLGWKRRELLESL